jgi:hypothetical protein
VGGDGALGFYFWELVLILYGVEYCAWGSHMYVGIEGRRNGVMACHVMRMLVACTHMMVGG